MDAAPATWDEFKGDLRASLRAWRVAPLLPLTSVALFLATCLPEPWWWFALPAFILAVGWVGTERIWYLRIFREQPITLRELLRTAQAFFWRFVRLGLVVAIVWSPLMILAFRDIANDPDRVEKALSTPPMWIASTILVVVMDFALTFVTPALTFSTKEVGEALRRGIRMLRDYWPHTAWYALVPPLAVVLIGRMAAPSSLSLAGLMAVSASSTLLNLWFKGATARFYLRRVQVGSQGAAFSEGDDRSGTSPAAIDSTAVLSRAARPAVLPQRLPVNVGMFLRARRTKTCQR
jgi:hypothetical protein